MLAPVMENVYIYNDFVIIITLLLISGEIRIVSIVDLVSSK